MAGNTRGPEGAFSRFLMPILTDIAPRSFKCENEARIGTPDIYVPHEYWSAWIEIKSTTVKDGFIDLSLFTVDQRKFLMLLPGSIGGFLLAEIRKGTRKEQYEYIMWGKRALPPAQTKIDISGERTIPRHELYRQLGLRLFALTY